MRIWEEKAIKFNEHKFVFPAMIWRDVTVTSMWFLHAGQRKSYFVIVAFSGIFTYIFVIYTGNANDTELRIVALRRIWADPW